MLVYLNKKVDDIEMNFNYATLVCFLFAPLEGGGGKNIFQLGNIGIYSIKKIPIFPYSPFSTHVMNSLHFSLNSGQN